jgi:hypothetical protein
VQKLKITAPKPVAKKLAEGKLSLEYIEKNEKRVYLLAFKVLLKPLYVGELLGGKSKIRRIEEKAAKHAVKTAQVMSDAQGKKHFTFVEIHFSRHEDMEAFEKEYKDALEFLSNQERK